MDSELGDGLSRIYTIQNKPIRKLNLGCGQTQFMSYINIDISSNTKAHILADGARLPFKNRSFDEVIASHVLEHFEGMKLDYAMKEIARVLKPGCKLIAKTPYGLHGLINPYHFHAFKKVTYTTWTSKWKVQHNDLFKIIKSFISSTHGFPQWHIERYFPTLFNFIASKEKPRRSLIPLRWPNELVVILERLNT